MRSLFAFLALTSSLVSAQRLCCNPRQSPFCSHRDATRSVVQRLLDIRAIEEFLKVFRRTLNLRNAGGIFHRPDFSHPCV
jgi:hypothetical protein